MKTTLNHIARDQHGQYYHNLGPHPRKALLSRLGRRSACKMYVNKTNGSTAHIGWIIGGLWLTVYEVKRMERASI